MFSGELGGVGDRSLDDGEPHWHDGRFVVFRLDVLLVCWALEGVAISSLFWEWKLVSMSRILWSMLAIAEFSSPGRPAVQKEEDAPGVLGGAVVGMRLFDVWAREWRHVELRLEALGREW